MTFAPVAVALMTNASVQPNPNPNSNPNPNPYTSLNQKQNDNPRSYSSSPDISSQEQLSLEQMLDHPKIGSDCMTEHLKHTKSRAQLNGPWGLDPAITIRNPTFVMFALKMQSSAFSFRFMWKDRLLQNQTLPAPGTSYSLTAPPGFSLKKWGGARIFVGAVDKQNKKHTDTNTHTRNFTLHSELTSPPPQKKKKKIGENKKIPLSHSDGRGGGGGLTIFKNGPSAFWQFCE